LTENERRRPDLPGAIGGVLAIVLGIAAYAAAADYSDLGAVFPRTIGSLLVALGVTYLAVVARGRSQRAAQAAGSTLRRAGVAVTMLGWAWALEPLGFLWSSALAFAALLFIANHERRGPRILALHVLAGALLLGGLYALFKHALQVPLP
jgi:hypothetical protein